MQKRLNTDDVGIVGSRLHFRPEIEAHSFLATTDDSDGIQLILAVSFDS